MTARYQFRSALGRDRAHDFQTAEASRLNLHRASTEPRDTTGFASSGQSPGTPAPQLPAVHLIGVGKVGQQFLERVGALPVRLVAVTDSTGTIYHKDGVDVPAVLTHKRAGGSILDLPRADDLRVEMVVALTQPEFVVDATPTDAAGTELAVRRAIAAVRTGATVVLCGKNALAAAAGELLAPSLRRQVRIDAALGGTGRQLLAELDELRAQCERIALVGNVTSTLLIEAIERGQSLEQGIAAARERGLLEADPTCDLDGSDAATKLVAVAGAVFGGSFVRAPSPADVPRQDLRELDVELLRERHRRGATTRLVARGDRSGDLRVAFEEVAPGSALAAPADRVVYTYELPGGRRVHTGLAVGAARTAAALCEDLRLALAGTEVRR